MQRNSQEGLIVIHTMGILILQGLAELWILLAGGF